MTPKVKILSSDTQASLETAINTFLAPFDPANVLAITVELWMANRGRLVCVITYQE